MQAKEKGWLYAGFWYWTIAGLKENGADAVHRFPTYNGVNLGVFRGALSDLNQSLELVDKYTRLSTNRELLLRSAATVHQSTNRDSCGDVNGVIGKFSAWWNEGLGD